MTDQKDSQNHNDLQTEITRLHDIMQALRDPKTGCPWDVEQDFTTIAPYTIEEAYEVADAIAHDDMPALRDELGDLLLQVVFHAQMAREAGHFTLTDVITSICDKMIRRHPHVFGDEGARNATAQKDAWEELKAIERAEKSDKEPSVLEDVATTLPAMVRAAKLQKRAARVGFDWPNMHDVIEKMHEETGELLAEWDKPVKDDAKIKDEIGDILFVASNIARKAGVDPETALLGCNRKFETRFRYVETALKDAGRDIKDASLAEMEALWQEAKSTT